MREGTTLRVMAADSPYCEFYDFYSVSPEYFGYTLVEDAIFASQLLKTHSTFPAFRLPLYHMAI
jgi:hypothetical protein